VEIVADSAADEEQAAFPAAQAALSRRPVNEYLTDCITAGPRRGSGRAFRVAAIDVLGSERISAVAELAGPRHSLTQARSGIAARSAPANTRPSSIDDTWEKVHEQLKAKAAGSSRSLRYTHGALLKGTIRCATCNDGMVHTYTQKDALRSR
jgi:hypothetical protein